MQIKYLTEKLQREMNELKIVRRNKRGLANFVGTAYKYLFGTLDNNDKEELEEKINVIAQNSEQVNELNTIIDPVNKGINIINKHLKYNENEKILELLVYNLEHFAEYIEDLEMGMQLARLGIFNPKLLKQDYLTNINSEILLNIKTSTWLRSDSNKIIIISHIPREIKNLPVYEILPYPDENNKILQDNTQNKYYVYLSPTHVF